MNPIQRHVIKSEFTRLGLSVTEGINVLDEAGLISNHCVELGDIANEDGAQSIEFLKRQPAKITA